MDYLVTAKHVSPKYALDNALVTVCAQAGKFHVDLMPFGSGKDYDTPEAAIRGLLLDNGCTSIVITKAK